MLRARSSRLRLSTKAAVRAMPVSPSNYYAEICARALAVCPPAVKNSQSPNFCMVLMRRAAPESLHETRNHRPATGARLARPPRRRDIRQLPGNAARRRAPGRRGGSQSVIDAGALVIDVRERAVAANSHLPGAALI